MSEREEPKPVPQTVTRNVSSQFNAVLNPAYPAQPPQPTQRTSPTQARPYFDRRPSAAQYGADAPFLQTPRPESPASPQASQGSRSPNAHLRPRLTPTPSTISALRYEVMVSSLHQKQATRLWYGREEDEGVMLRRGKGDFVSAPAHVVDTTFGRATAELNLPVAMTVNSRSIQSLLGFSVGVTDIPLQNGLRMQVIPTMEDLPTARVAQCGAFIADSGLLVVWDDEPGNLISRAADIEEQTTQIIWKMSDRDEEDFQSMMHQNKEATMMDSEAQAATFEERPTHLINTVLVALCLIIVIVLLGLAARSLAVEISSDKGYYRLAFLALVPIQIFFTLFFAQVIVGCLSQCVGPIKQMTMNSKFYSAVKSPRLRGPLPHVTIQCPVYKEGLESVIQPTVASIKAAMSTYELQGGSANIFINDDGMQLIPEEEQKARREFYANNGIGWTARPKHGENGFVRKGKFKKASNMNFGLNLSCIVEEKLEKYNRHAGWTQDEENEAYQTCLEEVLTENPRAWASGNVSLLRLFLILCFANIS